MVAFIDNLIIINTLLIIEQKKTAKLLESGGNFQCFSVRANYLAESFAVVSLGVSTVSCCNVSTFVVSLV